MLIKIDPHCGVPVYRQIVDQVRFQVTAGLLHSGEALESVRSLAATLSINSMTVSKAYALLEKEGVLEHRRGQQLVVADADYTQRENAEEAHLRQALAPAVTMIRQLEMSPRRAAGIFREMMEEHTKQKSDEVRR